MPLAHLIPNFPSGPLEKGCLDPPYPDRRLSQREHEEGSVPVLQKSPNAQNPGRNESRNCTKYLRELWWSKCGPKALESLAGRLGPGDGRPGPKSNSCKVTAELDPGVFEPSISPGGEKSGETYPPCPHTCSAAEPETRGSSAWGFPGGCRDSLPCRGVHH